MKRYRETILWAVFFILAGVFLLLRNLDVFGQWGDLIWGGIFALAGLGFLAWFIAGIQHWWRAIPAFTLLGTGAGLMLTARNIDIGTWGPSLVLFGMAFGFWAVLLVNRENWWAVIPAGVLTTVALLLGLGDRLDAESRLAVLFLGIGLTFLLLYVVRRDARWAAIPAGALLLLGVVTLVSALSLPGVLQNWWPLALVVVGLGVGVLAIVRGKNTVTPAPPLAPGSEDALPVAPGASVSTLPSVDELAASNPMPWEKPSGSKPAAADSGDVDIYDLIKKQPKE